MSFQRSLAVILIAGLLLSPGCASKGGVAVGTPNEPTYGQVKRGDTVMVEMPDGKRVRFVVEQIDGDTLVARGGRRFERKEIAHLWRYSFSKEKTASSIVIAGIVGLFVWYVIALGEALEDLY
jgi:hypothetical protein